ncbi:hypothetical protein K525DRAFT_245625 [Schizophyllum commune Loenen D]|nr:hypothetical protein K525DRAFT_245625 [Schizophyllum commune Loenen D]
MSFHSTSRRSLASLASLKSVYGDSLASIQAVEDMLIPRPGTLSRSSSCDTIRGCATGAAAPPSEAGDDSSSCASDSEDGAEDITLPLVATHNTKMQILAAARWVDEWDLDMVYGDFHIIGVCEDSEQYYLDALAEGSSDDEMMGHPGVLSHDESMDGDEATDSEMPHHRATGLAAEPSFTFSDAPTEPDYDAINYPHVMRFEDDYDVDMTADDLVRQAVIRPPDSLTVSAAPSPTPSPMSNFPRLALRPELSLRRTYMTKRLRVSNQTSPLRAHAEDDAFVTSPAIGDLPPMDMEEYYELASSPTMTSLTCPECGIQLPSLEKWVAHAKCYRRRD